MWQAAGWALLGCGAVGRAAEQPRGERDARPFPRCVPTPQPGSRGRWVCACDKPLRRAAVVDASQPAAFSRIVFAKLRTSACGAVSVSGGLAALLVTLCAAPPKPARPDCAEHGGVRARRWRARGGGMRATINFALHAYLALAVCFLLLRVDRRFGEPQGAAAVPDVLR